MVIFSNIISTWILELIFSTKQQFQYFFEISSLNSTDCVEATYSHGCKTPSNFDQKLGF